MKSFYCKLILIIWAVFILQNSSSTALSSNNYVLSKPETDSFPLIENCTPIDIYVDNSDFNGVIRAATDIQADIKIAAAVNLIGFSQQVDVTLFRFPGDRIVARYRRERLDVDRLTSR